MKETLRATSTSSICDERRLLAVRYTAYLDDSGTHGESEVVVAAGFVTNADTAVSLTEAWQCALNRWGIDLFHMADFESRYGQFKNWTQAEREGRLNCLLDLIEKHTFDTFGFVIPKRAFDTLMSDESKLLCGDAFGLAAIGCFNILGKIAVDPRLDGWVDYVFEDGSNGFGALRTMWAEEHEDPEWLNNNRILSLDCRSKSSCSPLQAADIIAYELYKQGLRQFTEERRPTRYPLKRIGLMHNGSKHWHYPTEANLRDIDCYLTNLWEKVNS